MSAFKTATLPSQPLDPWKRVKYSFGLVLDVDAFDQEQVNRLAHDRRHARALHGYGTVCGLDVTLAGSEVMVAAGLAQAPSGHAIRVAPEQCADLQDWLDAERLRQTDAPGGVLTPPAEVFVVACYRECPSDEVPIPGVPCRTEEESLVPSRTTESFAIRFERTAPEQLEEDAVQQLGELIERLEVTTDFAGGERLDPDAMRALVRTLAEPAPTLPETLRVHPDDLEAVLDAAFDVWITEVRAVLVCNRPADQLPQCVLLARLGFGLEASDPDRWLLTPDSVEIDETRRPYLFSTRLLQEYLLSRRIGDHGALTGLLDDDHPHYLLVDPGSRALVRNLPAAGNKITNLDRGTQPRDSVRLDQVMHDARDAEGDVTGTFPRLAVVGLRGRTLPTETPSDGQILVVRGNAFVFDDQQGGAPVEPPQGALVPLVTITPLPLRADLASFDVWFHLDAPDNAFAVDPNRFNQESVRIQVESRSDANLFDVPISNIQPLLRNLFRVQVRTTSLRQLESPCVRFLFSLRRIQLEDGRNLREFIPEAELLRFSGTHVDKEFAVFFVYVTELIG